MQIRIRVQSGHQLVLWSCSSLRLLNMTLFPVNLLFTASPELTEVGGTLSATRNMPSDAVNSGDPYNESRFGNDAKCQKLVEFTNSRRRPAK